jgi:hypothetical protein
VVGWPYGIKVKMKNNNKINLFDELKINTERSRSIKKFIKNYNIAKPDWSKVPMGFPHCQINELSKQEQIVWEAATMAWVNEHPTDYFGQILANGTIISIGLLFASTIIVSFLYYADVNYHLGLTFLTNFFA